MDSMRVSLERTVDDSYDIVFGNDIFSEIAQDLKIMYPDSRFAIVTDAKVRHLHANDFQDVLSVEGVRSDIFSFLGHGERIKTAENCLEIMGKLSQAKYDRNSVILALGGGVVGDMAGWIAANYLRGVDYVQIPTTVLAQADSSVGGKTGVDIPEYGKNLVGAFKQPKKVYIDVAVLQTLDPIHIISGLAETVKHGIIQDVEFFNYIVQNMHDITFLKSESMLEIARNNCRIKGHIVEIDPNEKGLRRILNYGHTAGHAIETLMNQQLSGNAIYPHGYAVSIGMMVAGKIAERLEIGMNLVNLDNQRGILEDIGLPTKIPDSISNEDIIEVTTRDKKAKDGKARYCLPSGLGEMCEFGGEYATHVDNAVVEKALDLCR